VEPWVVAVFCLAVGLGSYVQAVTGFALGFVVLSIIALSHALDMRTITAVISLLALLNVLVALRGQIGQIHRRSWGLLCLGQVPAIWVGVAWLDTLAAEHVRLLEAMLGAFVVIGSLSMLMRPQTRPEPSRPVAWVAAGAAGGLLGGLFSASGPVMGWFAYRQPLLVAQIRATLLACFAVTTTTRTLVVGLNGGLTSAVWLYVGVGVPLVLLGTWAGLRWRPTTQRGMRRVAFTTLLAMGAWLLVRAAVGAG